MHIDLETLPGLPLGAKPDANWDYDGSGRVNYAGCYGDTVVIGTVPDGAHLTVTPKR